MGERILPLAARELGASPISLIQWQLLGIKKELSFTVGYARVSSHEQKDDLITVFSARLSGSRSHKNRKLVEELKNATRRL